jgi:hypothetical protein
MQNMETNLGRKPPPLPPLFLLCVDLFCGRLIQLTLILLSCSLVSLGLDLPCMNKVQ